MDVETLFKKYGPMVYRRCLQLLRDPHEAEDLSQEVFLRLLERSSSLHSEYPSSLLWNMATHLCLNRIRDRKRRGNDTGSEDLLLQIACLDEGQVALETRNLLEKIFGVHPESSRTIAVLHFVDEMSLEEVAEQVKMSVSGVRKRIRALRYTLNLLEEK